MEWRNGSSRVCIRRSSRSEDRVYTRVRAIVRARVCLCTRHAAHRAGCMGLGAGAVGQRRSTPVRLFFCSPRVRPTLSQRSSSVIDRSGKREKKKKKGQRIPSAREKGVLSPPKTSH